MPQTIDTQPKPASPIAGGQKPPDMTNPLNVARYAKPKIQPPKPVFSSDKSKSKKSLKDLKDKKKEHVKKFMRMWFDQYFKMVTVVGCAVLLVASYVFVLHPQVSRARDLRGNARKSALEDQEKLQNQLDYLVRAQTDRRRISMKEIDNIDLLLPSSPSTPQILTSLEAIAKSSNADIESIDLVILDPDELSESDAHLPSGVWVVEIGASISSGSYDDLKSFLSDLEKNIRLMDVVAVVYSPIGKSYNVTIRSYYLPDSL
ncbi:hypothetical protein KKF64_02535 [Patescibacteria group bacterium]|nr:hypothetical protein [Patescibacteria group bacterium]